MQWQNWDKSLSCECRGILQPESVDEVQDLVARASELHKIIRVVGAGHSWSNLVPTNDWIVNLDKLNTILAIDHATETVEVEAGIRLRDLYPQLNKNKLAMANLGAITAQSLAGAVATGTHGTGLAYGCLGTQIEAVTMVDGQGNLREYNATDHPDWMRALRLNLGCLGIVVSVRLKCVADHNVRLTTYAADWNETLEQLPELVTFNERIRLYWLPGSDRVFINTMNRVTDPDDPGPVTPLAEAVLVRNALLGSVWWLGDSFPQAVELLDKLVELGYRDKTVVGPVDEAITTPMPPHHQEAESAVPLAMAVPALRAFDKLARDQGLRINVPSEIRFARGDDLFISPCNGGDEAQQKGGIENAFCFIGAYSASHADEPRLFSGFKEIMNSMGARPHWGKIGAPTRQEAERLYPQWQQFGALRAESDPQGTFANDYIRSLFGL